MEALRRYCRDCLERLLGWLGRLCPRAEVVFRPRPATGIEDVRAFCRERLGGVPEGVRILKDGSVREWVLASDVTASAVSTTLIEAAVAGKAVAVAEPLPLPESMIHDWVRVRLPLPGLFLLRAGLSGRLQRRGRPGGLGQADHARPG